MGDFNVDLLKCDTSYSYDYFYPPSKVVSSYLPIDKPKRFRSSSATLIKNIFVNTPDNIVACGNIISDKGDYFSQFCILKSTQDKTKTENFKMGDF